MRIMVSTTLIGISVLLLALAHSVTCNGWTTNQDVMDLAIGIHYNKSFTPPGDKTKLGFVVELIKEMANGFKLSANETRMAIVEFGTSDGTVLLKLKDSGTKEKVEEAVNKIGDSYTDSAKVGLFDLAHVTQRTRKLAFDGSDRVDVPKLAIIITTADKEKIKLQDKDLQVKIGHDMVLWQRGHPLVLSTYDDANGADVAYMHQFRHYRQVSNYYWDTVFGKNTASSIAKQVVGDTRSSLAACVYKKSTSSKCRPNKNNCIADVFYQNAFNKDVKVPQPDRWLDVERYCFKNGSTVACECPTTPTKAPITTTTTTTTTTKTTTSAKTTTTEAKTVITTKAATETATETAATTTIESLETTATDAATGTAGDEVTDDPVLIARLQNVCICLGICLLIATPIAVGLVLYAFKLRRELKALETLQKKISADNVVAAQAGSVDNVAIESADNNLAGTSSMSKQPEWTVFQPPDITQMPADDLLKQYGAKNKGSMKGNTSPKSVKSIKSAKLKSQKKG